MNPNQDFYCDFCDDTEYYLGVHPIRRRVQRNELRPSGNEIYNIGSGIRLNDSETAGKEIMRRNETENLGIMVSFLN